MCVELDVSKAFCKVFLRCDCCRGVNYNVVPYNVVDALLHCHLQIHFWIEREFQINLTILKEQFYRDSHVTWNHSWGSRCHWQSRYFFKVFSNKSYNSFNDVIKHYVTTCSCLFRNSILGYYKHDYMFLYVYL